MKIGLGFLLTVGMIVFACGSKNYSGLADGISGTYVREYTFKVVNPETGAEIGMRTIKDTIFIRPVDKKYEISNHKWMMNDFDTDGWRNMEHSEDRPMQVYIAVFASTDSSLIAEPALPLYLDLIEGKLCKAKKGGATFHRVAISK